MYADEPTQPVASASKIREASRRPSPHPPYYSDT